MGQNESSNSTDIAAENAKVTPTKTDLKGTDPIVIRSLNPTSYTSNFNIKNEKIQQGPFLNRNGQNKNPIENKQRIIFNNRSEQKLNDYNSNQFFDQQNASTKNFVRDSLFAIQNSLNSPLQHALPTSKPLKFCSKENFSLNQKSSTYEISVKTPSDKPKLSSNLLTVNKEIDSLTVQNRVKIFEETKKHLIQQGSNHLTFNTGDFEPNFEENFDEEALPKTEVKKISKIDLNERFAKLKEKYGRDVSCKSSLKNLDPPIKDERKPMRETNFNYPETQKESFVKSKSYQKKLMNNHQKPFENEAEEEFDSNEGENLMNNEDFGNNSKNQKWNIQSREEDLDRTPPEEENEENDEEKDIEENSDENKEFSSNIDELGADPSHYETNENNLDEDLIENEGTSENEKKKQMLFQRNQIQEKNGNTQHRGRHKTQEVNRSKVLQYSSSNNDQYSFDIGEPPSQPRKSKESRKISQHIQEERQKLNEKEKLKKEIIKKINQFKQLNKEDIPLRNNKFSNKNGKNAKNRDQDSLSSDGANLSESESFLDELPKPQSKTQKIKKNRSMEKLNYESRTFIQDSKNRTQYNTNPNNASYYQDKNTIHSPNNSWIPPQTPHMDLYNKANGFVPPNYMPPPFVNYQNYPTMLSQAPSNLQTFSSPQSIAPINFPVFGPPPGNGYLSNIQKVGNNFNNFQLLSPHPNHFAFIGSPQYVKNTPIMMPSPTNYHSGPILMNHAQINEGPINGFIGNQAPIIINNNVLSPSKKIGDDYDRKGRPFPENGNYIKIKEELNKKDLSKSLSENNFDHKDHSNKEIAKQPKYTQKNSKQPSNGIDEKQIFAKNENDNMMIKKPSANDVKPPLKASEKMNKTERTEPVTRVSCKNQENFVISDDNNNQKSLAELFLEKKGKLAEKLKKKDSEKTKEKEGFSTEKASKRTKEEILKQRKELMSNHRRSNKRQSPGPSPEKSQSKLERNQDSERKNFTTESKKTGISVEKVKVLERLALGIKPKMTKKEMIALTNKNYYNLEENKVKRQEMLKKEQQKEDLKSRKEKVKQLDNKVRKRLLQK